MTKIEGINFRRLGIQEFELWDCFELRYSNFGFA